MSKWFTIDPGVDLGWAEFKKNRLVNWGTIYAQGATLEDKIFDILDEVRFLEYADKVFIEWPSFQNTAAKNTGSIIKLACLIGAILGRYGNGVLIPVSTWKGSLPKEVTQLRAEKFFKVQGFKSHAADAVALGQYIIQKGLYK